MLEIGTDNEGIRYLNNYISTAFDGICHTGQAVTFNGTTDSISVPVSATGTSLIYFDYSSNKHIVIAVTESTTEVVVPAGTSSNVSVWNYTFTTDDLAYIDSVPEWISKDTNASNNIVLTLEAGSGLSNELCLAWYPMAENTTASSSIYDVVAGGTITLNNYTDARRTAVQDLNTGLQTLAYTQDALGRILGYAVTDTFTVLDTDDIVDTQYVIPIDSDWTLEEGIDLTHYVYAYNSTTTTLSRYVDETAIADTTYTTDPSTYKLDHDNLDGTYTNGINRQYFRFYKTIPEISLLYRTFIDYYYVPVVDNFGSYIMDGNGNYITET